MSSAAATAERKQEMGLFDFLRPKPLSGPQVAKTATGIPPSPPRVITPETIDLEDDTDVETLEPPVWLGVRGESFKNPDGTDRQAIIAGCREGDSARLVREPRNRYDSNAIAVHVAGGQIGYIAKEKAEILAPLMDDDMRTTAKVVKINGGTPDKPSRGVVVEVAWTFE